MSHPHAVWHFGLMAEYWALFKKDVPELHGLLSLVQRHGEPVLDLGCGAGRVLLGLLDGGVDADGVDISEDMIAQARLAAGSKGYMPLLRVQPMSAFCTGRKYRTIVIVDSFGLGGNRDDDLATLRCCRQSLQGGGALVLNIQAEYTTNEAWALWSEEGRKQLPEPWPATAIERVAPNGDVYRLRIRAVGASPLHQTYTREMRIEKWRNGQLRAQEASSLTGNMYLPSEVFALLNHAGFVRVQALSGFSDRPVTDDSGEIVFVAETA